MEDLLWSSATHQKRVLDAGEVTGVELRDAAIAACERLAPTIGFLVEPLFDRAPPGIPTLLKDAGQEIAGTPHYVGVAALRDRGARSTTTTGLAAALEGTGFSIIGKAACPALASGITTEPTGFAPTRNPWDLETSAGGSSGGSAAAVAAGVVSLAHGSDATGSLRCPAALCGVATLNPTAGRIPNVPPAGQPPSALWRDFVLARHAIDLQLAFELLTGATAVGAPGPLRVGLLDHDPELGMAVDPACRDGVDAAARLLADLGHHVDVSWPAALDHLWGACFGAFSVTSDASRPPTLTWLAERLGRAVRTDELAPDVFEAAARATARSPGEVAAAGATIDAAIGPMLRWWDDHDLLVTPATFAASWPLGGSPGPAQIGTLAAPFSLSGQPALALPLHHTAAGLPVGVQLVGRLGTDEVLLRLAADLQAASDWTVRRPPVAAP